ncbi:hypothetical protein KUTeg_018429 [Tegillarca granosa]|uniref:Peptide-N(4)-(N-acetyl-beta-glucosaminyl)asparagine amidase n=1 Tax=Tegillarca granosa TaxID=220873 RepID=A0ABQ9EKC9_TEGGR|nr:hypothetical protein KUTeg_018429 [Tegillarca granosa]
MAPICSSVRQLVNDNSKNDFTEAAGILLKFANNIINNPTEEKYKRIRLNNPTIENKLLPVSGALECLFEMGFEEFPENDNLRFLKQVRDDLHNERQKCNNVMDSRPAPHPSMLNQPSTSSPSVQSQLPNNQNIFQSERRFFAKIQSTLQHVLMYEDPSLQARARQVVPVAEIESKAKTKLESILHAASNKTDSLSIDIRDCFIICLIDWFKTSFFKWVDVPPCEGCGGKPRNLGMADPLPDDMLWGAGRVENYKCDSCQCYVRFPRYNHPGKLLETRRGRCGEWANCFTFICRSLGYEARYCLDWTDHVWTEYYSESQKRWIHCDTGENGFDKPLLYEVGWGKKLTYIIAFAKDDIQDVSWRYTAKPKEMLARRTECRESWLVHVIHQLWKAKQASSTPARREEMTRRLVIELVEFMSPKSAEGQNLSGRTTGSLEWRIARGEVGAIPVDTTQSQPFVFKLTDSEKQNKLFHIKYNCASDEYVLVSAGEEKKSGYASCTNKTQNLFRKVEHDWNMVYLARTEGSPTAAVTWKFDFTGLKIERIELCISSSIYENGNVSWRLCSKDQCVNQKYKLVTDLQGSEEMTLTATLTGGKGHVAWQHTQLFRQGSTDYSIFPFEVKVYFS